MLRKIFCFVLLLSVVFSHANEPSVDLRKLISDFSNIFNLVERNYVEPVSSTQLITNAIEGMIDKLDPHSEYLDLESLKSLEDNTSGQFGGLGIFIEYEKEENAVRVVAPIEDTPADKVGLKPGDLIIRVNDESFYGLSNHEILSRLKGKPGTSVKLTVRRKDEIFEQNIVRAIIKVTSVKYRWLEEDQGIAYIRITQFQETTAEDLQDALFTLKNEQELKGIVLDVRNNPGGLLTSAVDVSDLFLEKEDLIVYYKRRSGFRKDYYAKNPKFINGLKIVALINEGSASAAEIVVAALRQNNQAILVGRKTFGKGSVQSVLPISTSSGIKLTTAFYYTPDDTKIQAEGIKPDIEIGDYVLEIRESKLKPFREASYAKHLENGESKEKDLKNNQLVKEVVSEENKDDQKSIDPSKVPENIKDDIFVFTAIGVLKGLLSSSQPIK